MKPAEVELSIITVCYQAIDFIEQCIDQVISQKVDNGLEHLIIDGGSTDGTIELISSFAERFPHIRFISESDKGQSDAMNKGISLAKGKYIAFLNADDGYMPFTLKRVLDLLKRYEFPVVLAGNCKLVSTEGETLYINRPERLKTYHLYSGLEPYPINPAAYFYSKSIHAHPEIGPYNVDNHFNMDYEFFLRACLHVPIIYVNEDWGYMLDHPAAKTASDSLLNERKKLLLQSYKAKLTIIQRIQIVMYRIKKSIKTFF
jgi:glycosyltransferase involved in cell wall biosynthesis